MTGHDDVIHPSDDPTRQSLTVRPIPWLGSLDKGPSAAARPGAATHREGHTYRERIGRIADR